MPERKTTSRQVAMTPYKISKGADRFRRRWQAEDESGQHRFARRAYTPAGAVRLMARDVAFYERTGRKSPHQRRRLWWVKTRCRIGWHRWYDLRHGRACLACGLPAKGSSEACDHGSNYGNGDGTRTCVTCGSVFPTRPEDAFPPVDQKDHYPPTTDNIQKDTT